MKVSENIGAFVSKCIKNFRDFDITILKSLPKEEDIIEKVLTRARNNPESFRKSFREFLITCCVGTKILDEIEILIEDWKRFYRKYFGIDLVFLKENIPELRKGFDRLIIIPKDLILEHVFRVFRGNNVGLFKNISLFSYENRIPAEVDIDCVSVRKPTSAYAIWVRDCEWSDSAHRQLSPEMSLSLGINSINLLERLIFHLKYFEETGEHLDVDSQTFCVGSVYYDKETKREFVPTVSYQEFCPMMLTRTNLLVIHPFKLDTKDHRLRIREVVSK